MFMGFLDKVNKNGLTDQQVQAKVSTKVYPVIGSIFVIIGIIILVTEGINGNLKGGIFGFVIIGGLGMFYFIAKKINRRFLVKTGAADKTYKGLVSDYIKVWKNDSEENIEK
ncbi:hypothetical protein COX93_00615 [Candidatus Nomurabacteria bacterium CG_4_10_14_0_2_um_filter_30_12]|uniref:Uncharacterized protein n=2 Tax=Candidatus Nomuraibacteriota TaxID=1752729 RepID=A0A2J0MK46_9BACT|nr:MAG: hypothetical protein COU48_00800 [Candidatus Nomurabacteria bacterium CG10_big_fil_rev_8_21_14_0_10_03_31_7]PIZ87555.1 MAG: hypothetical protein COX93_00615 [Candidatus Nomurabacteria bacterium CG_4_10_14_0_2_um_filter_30_12]